MSEWLGTDLAASDGDLVVTASGDLALVAGEACAAADLAARLATRRGHYWRDPEFGFPWQHWLQAEWDAVLLRALQSALVREAERDPRVVAGSGRAVVTMLGPWAGRADVTCRLIGAGTETNLVLGFNLTEVTAEVLSA